METLPLYIPIAFVCTTLLTVFLFYKASGNSRSALLVLGSWLMLQTVISLSGFYAVTNPFAPRFGLLIGPPLIGIIVLFITSSGRKFLSSLDRNVLTLLHMIRIPVEIILFWLFTHKMIPEVMTFDGRNFDILSGITAPIIWYFGFLTRQLNRKSILFWNIICLILLLNIVIHAVLSIPYPFQQFGFDQPNIALLYFPFVWLPCCVVPLVLLSHLVVIRQLLSSQKMPVTAIPVSS